MATIDICPHCDGTGETLEWFCPVCNGDGFIEEDYDDEWGCWDDYYDDED
jgi:DnaJ-class molecular chaperone